MSGNPSSRKGARAELELAGHLTDHLGIRVRRKLGAGRQDDTGDLEGVDRVVMQAKNYRDVTRAISDGLRDLDGQKHNANADYGVLWVRRRGGQWVAVMPLADWCAMWRETL